jgi:hypothetical protein
VYVVDVQPDAGPLAGGTTVRIRGRGLTSTNRVTFDGSPAQFRVVSDAEVRATAPRGPGRTKHVRLVVNTPKGSAGANYTYAAPPRVTQLSPTVGSTSGGSRVTVYGENFIGVTHVYFGKTPASSVTVDSSNRLTVQAPAATPGTVHVIVIASGGRSAETMSDEYTYVPA